MFEKNGICKIIYIFKKNLFVENNIINDLGDACGSYNKSGKLQGICSEKKNILKRIWFKFINEIDNKT
jgi:hypothetical protein